MKLYAPDIKFNTRLSMSNRGEGCKGVLVDVRRDPGLGCFAAALTSRTQKPQRVDIHFENSEITLGFSDVSQLSLAQHRPDAFSAGLMYGATLNERTKFMNVRIEGPVEWADFHVLVLTESGLFRYQRTGQGVGGAERGRLLQDPDYIDDALDRIDDALDFADMAGMLGDHQEDTHRCLGSVESCFAGCGACMQGCLEVLPYMLERIDDLGQGIEHEIQQL